MTLTELSGIVTEHLPTNIGILLAGSQRHNTILSKTTDIDLVVLEFSFSHAQTFSLQHHEYKLDITVLPCTDLENTLLNEANDAKGGILHMLGSGVVIKDNFNLFPAIQQKANQLISEIGGKVFASYQQHINLLARSIKYISKPLAPYQATILLCDLVTTITELESIKTSNWSSKQHKFLLAEPNQENQICVELIDLYNEASVTRDFTSIGNFAEYYLKTAEKFLSFPVLPVSRLLIDLDYPAFSVPNFVESVLPALLENDEIQKSFCNFYISPRHYHKTYQNKITITLRITNHTHASDLVKTINQLFNQHFIYGKKYILLFQKNNQYTEEFFALIEMLRASLNEFIQSEVTTHRYSQILLVYHSLAIGSYLASSLRLSVSDCMRANSFLAQRSMLSHEEERQISGFGLLKRNHELKMQNAMSFYSQHSAGVLDYCNQGIIKAVNNDDTIAVSYMSIFSVIDNILNDPLLFVQTDQDISFKCLEHSQCDNVYDVYKYISLMSEILQFLVLSEPEKFNSLFCISRGISTLKNSGVKEFSSK